MPKHQFETRHQLFSRTDVSIPEHAPAIGGTQPSPQQDGPVDIARCPEHGLHGERTECFVCGGPVEQVPMVPMAERDVLADALEDLHRYSLVPDHGYAGSPCETKVRAALTAVGRRVP